MKVNFKLNWRCAASEMPKELVAWFNVDSPTEKNIGGYSFDLDAWKSREGFARHPKDKVFWVPVKEYEEQERLKKVLYSEPEYVVCENSEILPAIKKALKKMGIHLYKDPNNFSCTPSFVLSVKKMGSSDVKKFVSKQWK